MAHSTSYTHLFHGHQRRNTCVRSCCRASDLVAQELVGLLSQEERRIVSRPPQFPVEDKIRIVLSVLAGEMTIAA